MILVVIHNYGMIIVMYVQIYSPLYVLFVFPPPFTRTPCVSVSMKCSCAEGTLSARLTAVYLLSSDDKFSPWGRLRLDLYYSVAVPPQETAFRGSAVKPWSRHLRYCTSGSLSITFFRLQSTLDYKPASQWQRDSLKCFPTVDHSQPNLESGYRSAWVRFTW